MSRPPQRATLHFVFIHGAAADRDPGYTTPFGGATVTGPAFSPARDFLAANNRPALRNIRYNP